MARTQAEDYDDKRNAIAKKAAELFAKNGVSGASLAQIAGDCGMSKSLIYHYYKSKEDLLLDIMLTHMEELVGVVEEVDSLGLSGAEAFHAFSQALLEHYEGAAHAQKVLLYELDNLAPSDRSRIVGLQRQLIEYTQELLAGALGQPLPSDAELRARVMLFFGMLNWTHSWFKTTGSVSRDQLAEIAARSILKGN